jgi:hypothetical protein
LNLPFDGNSESVTQAATTENGVTYEQGKFGQAARFDARTDYVRLDDRAQYPADYSFYSLTGCSPFISLNMIKLPLTASNKRI